MNGKELRKQRQSLGLSQAKLSELCGVSQHVLSAFELGKVELAASLMDGVITSMTDKEKVASIATRSKRYRQHEYSVVATLKTRSDRAVLSSGNGEYINVLRRLSNGQTERNGIGATAVSLFSGCGGFSLGFTAAGFQVKGFVELEEHLRKIYRRNFPSAKELGGDIRDITQDAIEDFASSQGELDVIVGGPPCQGFSLSGKRDIEDPRNKLFVDYLRFVDILQPKVAVLENVRLLTSMKNANGGFVRDDICDKFNRHGYEIAYFEVNAKNYGVPQHRERVLFIATRSDLGISPSLPDITHGAEETTLFDTFRPYRTFADACSDLPYLESGHRCSTDPLHAAVTHPTHVIEWLWDVPEGCSAHDNEDPDLRPPSGYNTTYKRQVWDEPAATVQTTFGMISGCRNVHPIATRSLTVREAARIQSFPDTYEFEGSLKTIRTGIGNAVPPLLAFKIGQHIWNLLDSI